MYIPVTYFGGVGSLIASGGVESTYITGSVRYKVHEFRGISGSFNILSGKSNQIDILVVGGGGDNGLLNSSVPKEVYGGGGGAGGYIYSSSIFLQSGSFSVVGGARRLDTGGTSGLQGFNSSISGSQLNLTAIGGGGGGGWLGGSSYSSGDDGGSGGGAAGLSTQGSGTSGQGFQGGAASDGGSEWTGGGGGGAATTASLYRGGQGKINRIKNGQTIWYSGGARGGSVLYPQVLINGSGSAGYPANTPAGDPTYDVAAGGGGSQNDDTMPGTVIIRYPYQNVELWKCNCVKFEQVGTGLSSGSISYVQGNTGMYIEAEQVEITTPKYRLIVSGSENQVRAFPNLEYSGTPPYLTFSLVDLSFCP